MYISRPAAPVFLTTFFTNNLAAAGYGGGLRINSAASEECDRFVTDGHVCKGMQKNLVTIISCYFSNNHASHGGGVFIGGFSPGEIADSITTSFVHSHIVNNIASKDGGGLYIVSSPEMVCQFQRALNDTHITGNEAQESGGGMYVSFGPSSSSFDKGSFSSTQCPSFHLPSNNAIKGYGDEIASDPFGLNVVEQPLRKTSPRGDTKMRMVLGLG